MYKINAFYKLASLLDLIVTSVEKPYQEYKHEEKCIISIMLSEKTSQCEFVNNELHRSQRHIFSRLQIPLATFISGWIFFFY